MYDVVIRVRGGIRAASDMAIVSSDLVAPYDCGPALLGRINSGSHRTTSPIGAIVVPVTEMTDGGGVAVVNVKELSVLPYRRGFIAAWSMPMTFNQNFFFERLGVEEDST